MLLLPLLLLSLLLVLSLSLVLLLSLPLRVQRVQCGRGGVGRQAAAEAGRQQQETAEGQCL